MAWRERSKQRSVPQGSESYRGKEPTREMLLFGADRANNDGMRLWRCPRSRKPEGACPRWRVLDNRVDHRIDPIGIVMFSSGDLFPQPAERLTLSSGGVASLSSHLPYHLPGTCGPPDPCVGRAAASRLAHADASTSLEDAPRPVRARKPKTLYAMTVRRSDSLCGRPTQPPRVASHSRARGAAAGARRGGTLPP